MIDTMKIRLHEPRLARANHKLTVVTRQSNAHAATQSPVQMTIDGGDVLTADKMYYGDNLVTLNVAYHDDVYVTFSLPKVNSHGGPNIHSLTKEQSQEALGSVQRHLRDVVGIDSDFDKALVVRIDLFANAALKHSFQELIQLFDTLAYERHQLMRYVTTYGIFNSQRCLCIYDKKAEVECRRKDYEAKGFVVEELPENFIRWEYRLKNSSVVKRELGVKCVGDIISSWDKLADYYISKLHQALRYSDYIDGKAQLTSFLEELEGVMNHPRDASAVRRLIEAHGVKSILRNIGSLEVFVDTLKAKGYSPLFISRLRKKIIMALTVRSVYDDTNLVDLREELVRGLTACISKYK